MLPQPGGQRVVPVLAGDVMSEPLVLAIDQGTTSSKALLVGADGTVRAAASRPLSIRTPRPGWVEQDADELWTSVSEAIEACLAGADVELAGIAISNQRETVVAWDGASGRPVGPAISWQDQRGDRRCDELRTPQSSALVEAISGLELGSMYSATKIGWLQEHHRAVADLRVGTVDAWLLDRFTGGDSHACEAGNAARTLLFSLADSDWSPELVGLFGIDLAGLPAVRPSMGPWGVVRGLRSVPDGTPVLAMLGDSHAALYGHWALAPGSEGVGKVTYGTGSSVMLPVANPRLRLAGVGTTLAWKAPDPVWAYEGNILYSGAGMDWLARSLGVAPGADFSALAAEFTGAPRAYFVPALNGLGAPWWEADAVGTLTGLTANTTRAELAFAGISAVCHQVCDVLDAMDPDREQQVLHVGGGASASTLLMQTQANLLGRRLLVSSIPDISAVGVAALAFRARGIPFVPGADLAPTLVAPEAGFSAADRASARDGWTDALRRSGVNPERTTTP